MNDAVLKGHTKSVPYVRPDAAEFLAWNNARPESQTGGDMSPQAMRAWYSKRAGICDLPVGKLAETKDFLIPTPAGEIPGRLFDVRANRSAGPVVVFYHGGGFVFGDLDSHAGFCAEMSRVLDLPVVSVQYRCAPEGKWPAAPDDCEAAARWVAQSPTLLGRSVTSLVLCGDSAGGTLTIVAAMDLRDRPAQVPVIVQAPIYPSTDEGEQYPSYQEFAEGFLLTRVGMQWMQFHYCADASSYRAVPMKGDLKGLPPAVILTAGLDPLRDQGRAYAAALIREGVSVTFREAIGNIHGFVNLRKAIPSSNGDIADYLAVLRLQIEESEGLRITTKASV